MRVWVRSWVVPVLAFAGVAAAHATELITLQTGFTITCERHAAVDSAHTRLFLDSAAVSFVDVPTGDIVRAETVNLAATSVPEPQAVPTTTSAAQQNAAPNSIPELIRRAGERRSLNVDLLRAVVHAESGGKPLAVSRTGAQGLMQLMPGTARSLGVTNSFAPEDNLRGGTDYLDTLLRRYHEDIALALAAYNAGPAAVDRYHGIPPYRETRLYVARIIHEFNRQTLLAERAAGAVAPR